jgi:hypothetical protein
MAHAGVRFKPGEIQSSLLPSNERFVPIADRIFERHLLELKKEGSI